MKKSTVYKNAPENITEEILNSIVIDDFLPSPKNLVFKEETERVNLSLNKSSILFFKRKARELGIPYQRMIKRIVDIYARKYKALAQ